MLLSVAKRDKMDNNDYDKPEMITIDVEDYNKLVANNKRLSELAEDLYTALICLGKHSNKCKYINHSYDKQPLCDCGLDETIYNLDPVGPRDNK